MSDPAPARPLPAASLLLLRDRAGLEVLVGRRSPAARAFPGATVFPGGKLEAQDAAWPYPAWPHAEAGGLHVAAYAALRETFEETGVFLCASGEGPPPGADVAAARHAVEAGEILFADLVRDWGRALDIGRLTPFAHWITPERMPYRFDTHFFLVAASAYEAQATLVGAEFEQLSWERPSALLQAGEGRLITPTRHCLRVLQDVAHSAAAVETSRRRGPYDGERVRVPLTPGR